MSEAVAWRRTLPDGAVLLTSDYLEARGWMLRDGVTEPLYKAPQSAGSDVKERSVAFSAQWDAWPAGLIDRVKAAEQRIKDHHAPMQIPANPHGDVDLVLAEVRLYLQGEAPPFWIREVEANAPITASTEAQDGGTT